MTPEAQRERACSSVVTSIAETSCMSVHHMCRWSPASCWCSRALSRTLNDPDVEMAHVGRWVRPVEADHQVGVLPLGLYVRLRVRAAGLQLGQHLLTAVAAPGDVALHLPLEPEPGLRLEPDLEVEGVA